MSRFILTFQLEQQTPMIHFQYSETGACLRGSEVKPKLDYFLVQQLNNGEDPDDKYELGMKKAIEYNWLIEKEHRALDYKISICAKGEKIISNTIEQALKKVKVEARKVKINEMYFGNMVSRPTEEEINKLSGRRINKQKEGALYEQKKKEIYEQRVRENYKETILYKEPISVKIVCFKQDLLNFIKQHIAAFFLLNNFGTRQNKGFGSFKLIPNDEIKYDVYETLRKYKPSAFYINYNEGVKEKLKSDYNNTSLQGSWKERSDQRLTDIRRIYMLMKGGINETSYIKDGKRISGDKRLYYKGFIFRYYLGKRVKIENEKSFMKQKIEESRNRPKKNQKYVRGVLGIADKYRLIKKEDSDYKNKSMYVFSDSIARYPSPITFKVVDEFLFIIPHRMPKELKNNPIFYFAPYKMKKGKIPSNTDEMEIPKEFDIEDFLYAFAEDFNNKGCIRMGRNVVRYEIRYENKKNVLGDFIRLQHAILKPLVNNRQK